jgi:AcrR family transcriptional regulator
MAATNTQKDSVNSAEPTTATSREQAKAETREAIITAAIGAFAEQGLDGPSLDAICARAGYTRGAFYVHFKDREDLIAAVIERFTGLLLDTIVATGDAAMDLERTVRSFVDAVEAGMYPFHGAVAPHQIIQACTRSPALRSRYVATVREAIGRVEHAAREGQQANTVRQDVDAAQVATLLIAIVLAVQTLREIDYPFDARAAGQAVLRLLQAPRPSDR